MSSSVRFMYIRNKSWEPIGCVAIRLNRGKKRAEYGLSMRNPLDAVDSFNRKIPFDRKLAQSLASLEMAKCSAHLVPNRVFINSDADMHEITNAVMKDIIARGEAASGAVKFAKLWLDIYGG